MTTQVKKTRAKRADYTTSLCSVSREIFREVEPYGFTSPIKQVDAFGVNML